MKSIISWVGAKQMQAQWILSHFPPRDYKMYCEPFAGSCAMLLAHDHIGVKEVVNDLDDSLINLWEIVRLQPEELIAHLSVIPYARQRFRLWRRHYLDDEEGWRTLSDMERAVRFFYLARTAFSAWISRSNAGFQHQPNPEQASWAPRAFRNAAQHIRTVSQRIQEVLFENLDFARFITKYDHDSVLFYVDQPYTKTVYQEKSQNAYYKHAWTEADDRRLAGLLRDCRSRVIASNYGGPLVDELYDGWRRVEKQVHCPSTSRKPSGHLRTELLLMNYDAEGRRLV